MFRALRLTALFLPLLLSPGWSSAQTAKIDVDLSRAGAPVAPSMYGIFFEEINHAGDGGLYAEMIQNRSFEETLPIEGTTLVDGRCVADDQLCYNDEQVHPWSFPWNFSTLWPAWWLGAPESAASLSLESTDTLHPNNPRYLRVRLAGEAASGEVKLFNNGYWGVAVKQGEQYRVSLFARPRDGYAAPLTVGIFGVDGQVVASHRFDSIDSSGWKQYTCTLKAEKTIDDGKFFVAFGGKGAVDLDVVSLMPVKTFKGRVNGMREDLAKLLAELKPEFVRFPGGCFVEGATWENRYRWKETIGPIEERPGHWCLWGYRSTDGLGYHEYLQFCEDIGSNAMYVANVGLSCCGRHGSYLPDDRLDEQIQETLDAVEYAIGPADSTWGALRAKNGHPEPFPLKYIELGNENGGPRYERYYRRFHEALKAKYPQLIYIADTEVPPTDTEQDDPCPHVDLVDHHYYNSPDFFFSQSGLYDAYDRNRGYKVYLGESACNTGVGTGNLLAALSEAAFLTGLERNGDLVTMVSYAPLMFNVNRLDWPVNMIGYDNDQSFGRSSYYVQKMFTENRPDYNVGVESRMMSADESEETLGMIGLGSWTTQVEYKDVVVRQGDKVLYRSDFSAAPEQWKPVSGTWETRDGLYAQSDPAAAIRSLMTAERFGDCTIELKARKTAGAEGFLILFGATDDNNYYHLNLGGWGNREHAFERGTDGHNTRIGRGSGGAIEAGRWYDIRIEIADGRVEAFLDGRSVARTNMQDAGGRFAACAGYDTAAGELIVKVVNGLEKPVAATLNLTGAGELAATGRAIKLAGNPLEENDVENPERIAPKETTLENIAEQMEYVFPASSVTILRVKARR